jgi:hypothetical protein
MDYFVDNIFSYHKETTRRSEGVSPHVSLKNDFDRWTSLAGFLLDNLSDPWRLDLGHV